MTTEEVSLLESKVELLRKQDEISQESFAKETRVSRQTVNSVENGRYNPSLELAFAIANYFGMSIEEIFIYDRRYGREKTTRI